MLCLAENNLQRHLSAEQTTQNNPSSYENADHLQQLGPYDVICGRHRAAFGNIGNRRFRITVALSLDRYKAAPTRDKSIIIHSVTALVRSCGGRFLQRQKEAWVELDDKMAHVKVGHALRDMAGKSNNISNNNKSTEQSGMSQSEILKAFAARWKFPMYMKLNDMALQSKCLQWNAPMEKLNVAEEPHDCEEAEDYEYDAFSLTEETMYFDYDEQLQASINSNKIQEQQQIHQLSQEPQQYTDEALLVSEFEDSSDAQELLLQNIDERELSIDDYDFVDG